MTPVCEAWRYLTQRNGSERMMRRKRATDWRALVDQQAGSSLSAAAFCRHHQLNLHQFYQREG